VLLIGLTGGIGSGKSTVARSFAARGAVVIDADAIVRELQAPGQPVLASMVERFGAEILRPDGTLDRQAVADRVFGDAAELAALNAIVHPAVAAEIGRRIDAERDGDRIVVLDVPLLVEGGHYPVSAVVVVDVDPELAIARLVEHRGFTAADARARMARQASREERLARADFVVSNDGGPDELEREIDRCWAWISALMDPAHSSGEGDARPSAPGTATPQRVVAPPP
jgi:dephospho-CoA kinase